MRASGLVSRPYHFFRIRYLHHKRPYARHFFLPYLSSPDATVPGQDSLVSV